MIVLIGFKSEMDRKVTKEEGEAMSIEIGATAYVEVSSKNEDNVYVPLGAALSAFVVNFSKTQKKKEKCILQ